MKYISHTNRPFTSSCDDVKSEVSHNPEKARWWMHLVFNLSEVTLRYKHIILLID